MDALIAFFIFCQAFGALVGAVTAVWSELAYVHALKDGYIDHAEREHLRVIGHGLRFGLLLLLLSSIGLVVVAYVLDAIPPALTISYWIFMAHIFLIVGASWALSRKHISFALGSAIAFTAWWFLVYLTFGQMPAADFGANVAYFVVAAGLMFFLLIGIRRLAVSIARKQN